MKKLLAVAFAVAAMGSQAALTTLSAPYWTPGGSTGLGNVLFNVTSDTSGNLVALGAHAYKNSAFLPNDGTDTFYAQPGLFTEAPNYANWSFDFSYSIDGSCTKCAAYLRIDTDPSAATNFVEGKLSDLPPGGFGASYKDSWNMKMPFLLGLGFDPFSASSTAFELVIRDAAGAPVVATDITVNVPEPTSLALVALALLGAAGVSRRKA